MSNVPGAGGNKAIAVAAGENLTVDSFGVFGTGATPVQPAELDTLKFTGSGMTAANLVLTQSGADVLVTFQGDSSTLVRLTNVTTDQLENIAGKGNFRFFGQSAVTESIDVFAAPSLATVEHSNSVTFLSESTDLLDGKDNSNDIIHGQGGGDTLDGAGGNDRLYGELGNDHLSGGSGNDVLDGGQGADHMEGGTGNDIYYVDNAKDVIVEAANASGGGIDKVVSSITYTLGADLENLTLTGSGNLSGTGNTLNNVIVGNDGNNTLRGGEGNDTLDGGIGQDTMSAGVGNDTYIVDNAKDSVSETVANADGGGIDTVMSSVSFKLGGNLDNLTLTGSDNIDGTGNALANIITGNDGNNVLSGGAGNDTIAGGDGSDYELGGNNDDVLKGGFGDDTLIGDAGNDQLTGGVGNDTLDGGTGNDAMAGGDGLDNYVVDSTADKITENANEGQDQVFSSVTYTLGANLEYLSLGGSGNIDGTGNGLTNVIVGNAGANVLSGGGGDDVLYGAKGDTLNGGDNDDLLFISAAGFKAVDGGTGIDWVSLEAVGKALDLTGSLGASVKNVEVIDLSGTTENTVYLDAKSVAAMSGGALGAATLAIFNAGNTGDTVHLDKAWTLTGTTVNPSGVTGDFNVYTSGGSTLLIDHNIIVANGPAVAAPPSNLGSLDAAHGTTIIGKTEYGATGYSVSAAGDVNGDGFGDVVLSSITTGTAYFVFGSAAGFGSEIDVDTLAGSAGFKLTDPEGQMHGPAHSIGDINGDGLDDFALGALFADSNGLTDTGAVYVVFGSTQDFGAELDVSKLDGSNGFRMNGLAEGDALSVLSSGDLSGDVNGDGFDDLVVTAFHADVNGNADVGKVYVVFGHSGDFNPDLSKLDGSNGFEIDGVTLKGQAGFCTGTADVNGDGYADILIGAPGKSDSSPGFVAPGSAYVVFGHAGGFDQAIDLGALTASQGFEISGPDAGNRLGFSVDSAGDINGDGFDDILVSAVPNYSSAAYGPGDVYVLYGKASGFTDIDVSTLKASQGFVIHGVHDGDNTGHSVSSAGDINGDGYADIIIGAPADRGSHATGNGAAYVVFGHAGGFSDIDLGSLDAAHGFKLAGVSSSDETGYSVAGAGDVNGDGFDDLIVGAYYADPHGVTDAGAAYIVYGGSFTGAVTHLGTAGSDTFDGTAKAESFVGGTGDDIVNAGGGKDVVQAGAGADEIHVKDNTFFRIDGGGGSDTLHLDYAGAIDFGNLDGKAATSDRGKIAGIETISADNGAQNAMTLHLADVLDMHVDSHAVGSPPLVDNVLKIDGNAGDTLHLFAADGWTAAGTSLGGFAVYTHQGVNIAVDSEIAVTVG